MKVVGKHLREYRGKDSQKSVADKADVCRMSYSNWENGKTCPNACELFKLMKVLAPDIGEFCQSIQKQFNAEIEPKLQAADRDKIKEYMEKTKKKRRG